MEHWLRGGGNGSGALGLTNWGQGRLLYQIIFNQSILCLCSWNLGASHMIVCLHSKQPFLPQGLHNEINGGLLLGIIGVACNKVCSEFVIIRGCYPCNWELYHPTCASNRTWGSEGVVCQGSHNRYRSNNLSWNLFGGGTSFSCSSA